MSKQDAVVLAIAEVDDFLRRLGKTDPDILIWIRSLLSENEQLRAIEAATPAADDALRAALEQIHDEAYDTNDECRWCDADYEDGHREDCPAITAQRALLGVLPLAQQRSKPADERPSIEDEWYEQDSGGGDDSAEGAALAPVQVVTSLPRPSSDCRHQWTHIGGYPDEPEELAMTSVWDAER